MTEGLSTIVHKGKTIICADYSGLRGSKEKTLQLINALEAEYQKAPPNSVLGISIVKNIQFDMEILNRFKAGEKLTTDRAKKVAIVGVSGLVKAGYNFVFGFTNTKYKAFDSIEEAKEWLVND